MIVCICKRVSDKDIQKCIEAGCGFEEIKQQTGACTNCGMCKDCINQLVEQAQYRIIPIHAG